ncbi:hypothetical protein GGD56_002621 [Rhizobium mongolense]|uniref:Uncharacterized protein n=1 Tax=Rhizobium mongolense TaxID=57676 RepID=A0ABR6ILN7_9HYPH|nr:hypothetical protein [Rhizobium mongolense]MBB4228779.1 hypothetical protein [Rhizobium mongolense]
MGALLGIAEQSHDISQSAFSASLVADDRNEIRVYRDLRSVKPSILQGAAVGLVDTDPVDIECLVLIDAVELGGTLAEKRPLRGLLQSLKQALPCRIRLNPSAFTGREIAITASVVGAIPTEAVSIASGNRQARDPSQRSLETGKPLSVALRFGATKGCPKVGASRLEYRRGFEQSQRVGVMFGPFDRIEAIVGREGHEANGTPAGDETDCILVGFDGDLGNVAACLISHRLIRRDRGFGEAVFFQFIRSHIAGVVNQRIAGQRLMDQFKFEAGQKISEMLIADLIGKQNMGIEPTFHWRGQSELDPGKHGLHEFCSCLLTSPFL